MINSRCSFLLACLCVLLGGCTNTYDYRWYEGDVEVLGQEEECRPVKGEHSVLEIYRFRATPVIPFAWSGYRLFVQVPLDSVKPGARFAIPSEGVDAVLCSLSHNGPEPANDLEGTLEILRIRNDDAIVSLDLKSREHGWDFRGRKRFVRQGLPRD
ncbi:MAG TPA: hypothetical protein VIW92_11195 [Thermoanaerobaculia bacterium]